MKPDLTLKVICANCGRNIATTDDDFYLPVMESGHCCVQVQSGPVLDVPKVDSGHG